MIFFSFFFFFKITIIQVYWHNLQHVRAFLEQEPCCSPQPGAAALPAVCLHVSCFAPIYHECITAVRHRHNLLAHYLTSRSAGNGPSMSNGYPKWLCHQLLKLLVLGSPFPWGQRSPVLQDNISVVCTAMKNRVLHQGFALAEAISGKTLYWMQFLGCSHSLCMLEACCCCHPWGFSGWSFQVVVAMCNSLPVSCFMWHSNNVITILMALSLSFRPPHGCCLVWSVTFKDHKTQILLPPRSELHELQLRYVWYRKA